MLDSEKRAKRPDNVIRRGYGFDSVIGFGYDESESCGNGVVGAPLTMTRSRTRRPVTRSGSISLAVQGLATLPDNDVVWSVIPVTGETVHYSGRGYPYHIPGVIYLPHILGVSYPSCILGARCPSPHCRGWGLSTRTPAPRGDLHAGMTQPDWSLIAGGVHPTDPERHPASDLHHASRHGLSSRLVGRGIGSPCQHALSAPQASLANLQPGIAVTHWLGEGACRG